MHCSGRVFERAGLLAVVVALGLFTGCVTVGHRAIRSSRTDYNMALRQTEDEQLLLNLVRLRYRDRPFFLEATALNTQFSYAPSAQGSIALGGGSDVPTEYGLGGKIAFEEKPTVTYIPLQGADYVKRIMSAVPIETMVLLDSSGWSSERIFRVCLQRMNGLQNAPRAAGPTPHTAPDYMDFLQATRLLRELELHGGIEAMKKRVGEDTVVTVQFSEDARKTAAFQEFVRLLDLDPEAEAFKLSPEAGNGGQDRITLRARSFAGALYFLSQSVEVPPADAAAGRVTVTRDADGNPFDWNLVTEGLMRIRWSSTRPENSAVAVRYRDAWFFIDDSDLDSKSTFSMLAQLYSLQAGGSDGLAPVLTLPVGE